MRLGGATIETASILVIEKDETIAVRATTALEEAGYTVIRVVDFLDGLKQLHEVNPDLIIMNRELPTVNGEDPCLRVREACYLPIIATGAAEEAVEILELGADAFMTKPLNLRELVARVKTLLRRNSRNNPPRANSGSEITDQITKSVNSSNQLTLTEFRLASCLVFNKSRLLDYHQLINDVWGLEKVSLDTLHFHMRHLRKKLRGYSNCRIVSFRGVGYRWEERKFGNAG